MIWFSNDVKDGLFEYLDSLVRFYPVSLNRAIEKFEEMFNFAYNIRSGGGRVCPYRDLGQLFDRSGKPIIPFLKIVKYTDRKSKSQWYFSYFDDEINGNILVYKMKYTRHVIKEQKKISQIILETIQSFIRKECI